MEIILTSQGCLEGDKEIEGKCFGKYICFYLERATVGEGLAMDLLGGFILVRGPPLSRFTSSAARTTAS